MPATAASAPPATKLPYYTPLTIHKHWAPEEISVETIQKLGEVYKQAKMHMNYVARKFFLATWLIEGHGDSFSMGATDLRDLYDRIDRLLPGTDCEQRLRIQCMYTGLIDYKTGTYATRVLGANASTEQRLAIWNGRGRVTAHTGKVLADADHHAAKVLAMHRALRDERNSRVLKAWIAAGGDYID